MQRLVERFKRDHATAIKRGCIRNNCEVPVRAFVKYAKTMGYAVERVYGDFIIDNPEYHFDDYTQDEKLDMLMQGYDPHLEADRVKYTTENDLVDELKKVPHYWNEYNGQIIDFTASAQFVETGLAADTNKSRYIK